MEHVISVADGETTGRGDRRYIAICSCGRWRSSPYATRGDALDNAERHRIHGDLHNRAQAAMGRGPSTLATQLVWYEKQAADELNSAADRKLWQQLADEARERLRPDQRQTGQDSLF